MPRRLSTLATAALFAVMVGVRESTGLAPPPPTLSTEEIEWLSPERPDAGGFYVVFENPEIAETSVTERSERPSGLFKRILGSVLRSRGEVDA